MAVFEYTGRLAEGAQVQGKLEAASVDAVLNQLRERGVTPVTINALPELASGVKIEQLLGQKKVTAAELIMFSRQMYTITKAGIPLVRGLRGLAASIGHSAFQTALLDVAVRLEAGTNLSNALARHPEIFNRLYVSMIGVGESTGSLEEVFEQLAFYLERDDITRKRILSAVRYPMFVVIALAIATTVVNLFVIPKFADLFAQFNADLPLVTQVLLATSFVFVNYWWLLLAFVLALAGGFVIAVRTSEGAVLWGRYKLRLPVVGGLIERASMARYCRSFGLMLRAGVPLNQALSLCARAMDNAFLSGRIDSIRRGVERGESLLHTHRQAQILSPLVLQMIAVGEESGQVEELLTEVAEFYDREVDYDLKKLADRIEPILIVVMASFVLVLALGIFLPMWDMYSVQKAAL